MPENIGHLISRELLAALRELYPLRPPLLTMTDREVWFSAGQQRLIEFLQAQHDDAATQPLLSE